MRRCRELIQSRLQVLGESVSPEREIYYHPGTQDEHMAFLYHIDQKARDFCDIMNFIYHVMTNELKRACVQQNLMVSSTPGRCSNALSRGATPFRLTTSTTWSSFRPS
jgi:hypothetical protein